MIRAFLRWLLQGSEVQTMHPDWLAEKMPDHDVWTRSQADPRLAIIVSNSAAMARRQFWQRVAEKQTRLVKQYPRRLVG